MSRAKLTIGKPQRVAGGLAERAITLIENGVTFNTTGMFRVVNGYGIYSIAACSDETFAAINESLSRFSERRLARLLERSS